MQELLNNPLPKNVEKALSLSLEYDWDPTPITLVMRFSKSGCPPFFMTWEYSPETNKFRFMGARVNFIRAPSEEEPKGFSGKLTLRDTEEYMRDPRVILLEEPIEAELK